MITAIVGTCGRGEERTHTRVATLLLRALATHDRHNDSAHDTPPTCLLGCDLHATVTSVEGARAVE